ncbi:MAG TPA: DUF4442 domain-containing protein [Flavobacteriia bacterium]|nr:DUF4442 domain-containing protein [Flavobacteriia bacterium]
MLKFTVRNMNRFLLFKIPSAYFAGVRVSQLTDEKVVASVKHKWRNQNPFNSMYWAVQGMASELTTGVLVMKHIAKSKRKISMLVTHQEADFYKKAKGLITFSCEDGKGIESAIQKTVNTGEGQILILKSDGFNEEGIKVSSFSYTWSIKLKN